MHQKKVFYPEYLNLRVSTATWKTVKAMADEEQRPPATMGRILVEEAIEARNGKKGKRGHA